MPLTETELLLRLAVAVVMGAAIGYERELRELPAGLRTHLLVALASATFTLVSIDVAYFQHFRNDGVVRIDAGRIASNIVVGIGFLGGGAILQSRASIKGMTTAASLWHTAAVGMAAGGGMFVLATAGTVVGLFALAVLRLAVEVPRKRILRLTVGIELEGDFVSRASLLEFLAPVGGEVTGVVYRRDLATNRSRMKLEVRLPRADLEEPLMKRLEELPGLRRVKVARPD